jgi:hypothetical protein
MKPKQTLFIDKIEALGFGRLADQYSMYIEENTNFSDYLITDLYCIGIGVGCPKESHELLTLIHKELNPNQFMIIAKGCVKGSNYTSLSFLINSTDFVPVGHDSGLELSLIKSDYHISSMLMFAGAKLPYLCTGDIKPLLAHAPKDAPKKKLDWYASLIGLAAQNVEDFSLSVKGLDIKEIPENIINYIKGGGIIDMSLCLLEKGISYDTLLDGYNEDRLPVLQSLYLETLTRGKLKEPARVIQAPKLNI